MSNPGWKHQLWLIMVYFNLIFKRLILNLTLFSDIVGVNVNLNLLHIIISYHGDVLQQRYFRFKTPQKVRTSL